MKEPRRDSYMELVCPAGNPAALETAVLAGADSVYCGLKGPTNARNYPGLNFDPDELKAGVAFAHAHGCKIFVAINTFPRAGDATPWRQAVDASAEAEVDAVILADVGLLAYATKTHPTLRRHLSVQAAASNPLSIAFYREQFDIKRLVLPRVLALDEIRALVERIGVEVETFVFGSLGTMVEGRCFLSSYITGISPSSDGACAPASHVAYREEGDKLRACLGSTTLNIFDKNESAAYPTPCKGRFLVNGKPLYLFEEPVGLNLAQMLPDLKAAGVTALKIEGRQRSRAYVEQVVRAFRTVLDALARGEEPALSPELRAIVEGGRETCGAFRKGWR